MELQLKKIRRARKITQQGLADALGLHIKTIGNWESGKTMLGLDDACRVCDALGCTPNDLCGWYIDHPEDRPAPPGDAALFADPYQAELHECYEASTPEGRSVILGTARGQRELSLKASERGEPQAEGVVSEAV